MKRLITAETVRQEHASGKKSIEVALPQCIVTAEARLVAEQLGLAIVEVLEPQSRKSAASAEPSSCPVNSSKPKGGDDYLAKIRAEVMSRLPPGTVSEAAIEQLVRKFAAEDKLAREPGVNGASPVGTPGFNVQAIKGGIKKVAGDSVRFGLFEGAGRENQVGITDVITGDDGSSMAAGFMSWKKCFFPWTLTYDEVDYVIEGELHIRCGGETVVGKAGDVIFIPKGSAIEFGTTSEVRFLYVAYPANWQDV